MLGSPLKILNICRSSGLHECLVAELTEIPGRLSEPTPDPVAVEK
jgi:hypothetical protein